MNRFWKITTIINLVVIISGTTCICISAATAPLRRKTPTVSAKVLNRGASPDELTASTLYTGETTPQTIAETIAETDIATEKPTQATQATEATKAKKKVERENKPKKAKNKTSSKSSSVTIQKPTQAPAERIITPQKPKPIQQPTNPDSIYDGEFLG